MKKNIIKFFLFIIFLTFSQKTFAGKANWVEISRGESEIIFGRDFYLDADKLTYEMDKAANNTTRWEWIWNDSSGPNLNISWYKLQKDYMVYNYPVYLPKKRIKNIFGYKKSEYKWSEKRVSFKSLGILVNYRKFKDTEYDQDCFIFGMNIVDENNAYKESDAPYAVLEGNSCKSTGSFSNEEIETIINNIGIRKIRDL